MRKFRRFAAETLIEVLTAMTVFGILIAGVTDFMANQTLSLARAKDREKMMYSAQMLITHSSFDVKNNPEAIENTGVKYTLDNNVLTLYKGGESMTFKLQ